LLSDHSALFAISYHLLERPRSQIILSLPKIFLFDRVLCHDATFLAFLFCPQILPAYFWLDYFPNFVCFDCNHLCAPSRYKSIMMLLSKLIRISLDRHTPQLSNSKWPPFQCRVPYRALALSKFKQNSFWGLGRCIEKTTCERCDRNFEVINRVYSVGRSGVF
jgi:hypothetical protein